MVFTGRCYAYEFVAVRVFKNMDSIVNFFAAV